MADERPTVPMTFADAHESFAEECIHPGCVPSFDEKAAEGLEADEVRRRWPRFQGKCPACEQLVIVYASVAHYIAGDW
jgi:hypothetical protein